MVLDAPSATPPAILYYFLGPSCVSLDQFAPPIFFATADRTFASFGATMGHDAGSSQRWRYASGVSWPASINSAPARNRSRHFGTVWLFPPRPSDRL
jgi:hypothetical protein